MAKFKPGQSGNPAGKPPGTRHRATKAAELLLDGEAEDLTRKAIELAKAGDTVALRLCLDRIIPARRDKPIVFSLPPIDTTADLPKAPASRPAVIEPGPIIPGGSHPAA